MAKKGPKVSKKEFILSQPAELSPREVVEKAKEAGMSLTEQYVYVVRSGQKGKPKRRGRPPKAAAKKKAAAAPAAPRGRRSLEAEFRRIAIELGLDRAADILSDTQKKVQDVIAGR